MKTYGLIGRNISYSFSRAFFSKKFEHENIDAEYVNFDLQSIDQIHNVLKETYEKINAEYLNFDLASINQIHNILKEIPTLSGLNVTIPYKEDIIPFLSNLDPIAKEIGAVNTVKIENDGSLTGYNTDYFGFQESLKPHLQETP